MVYWAHYLYFCRFFSFFIFVNITIIYFYSSNRVLQNSVDVISEDFMKKKIRKFVWLKGQKSSPKPVEQTIETLPQIETTLKIPTLAGKSAHKDNVWVFRVLFLCHTTQA